jgi:hypothetical protein
MPMHVKTRQQLTHRTTCSCNSGPPSRLSLTTVEERVP